MDYDELANIDNKFCINNRTLYNYIGKIDSSLAIKINRPKHTYSKMSEKEQLAWENEQRKKEEERTAKKNNKKTLPWQKK